MKSIDGVRIQTIAFALAVAAAGMEVCVPLHGIALQREIRVAQTGITCPRSCDKGTLRFRSVVVSSVDERVSVIIGKDGFTHHQVDVQYCDQTVVNGRTSIRDIRSGDVVNTKEVKTSGNAFIAVELNVNLLTAVAEIRRRELTDRFAIVVLNDQTLKPVSKLNPTFVGVLPTSAVISHGTTIARGGIAVKSNILTPGSIVKIYGYKSPRSTIVTAFRIEILRSLSR